ncbi:sugar ABC transporter permease [Nakamurella antarctica]|uniref:Sugar ABC transporter permease n=1 Tax=Nakamurella antarctica TaxID=1902245 RepID=A0A3G8ZRW2_9ACTN|nr:sugar ABC transporter permease [Nakamurella antarctica]AZI56826.1 sugar ABC transporter permease [Nakamurella antarctica]
MTTTAADVSAGLAPAPSTKSRSGPGKWQPWLFLFPFLIPFVLFYVAPIAYAFYQSLFKIERTGGIFGKPSQVFAGLSQYASVFSDQDFRASILRVLVFGIVQIPVMLLISLGLALLLDSTLVYFKRFLRISFFVPYGVPGVIAAIMWGFIYSPNLSPIVALLNKLNISIDFLGTHVVLWSIANVVTWTYAGYNMLIIYSALLSIPQEIFEAARLDGASNWDIARRIKIPSVAPALVLTGVFSIIGTLQLFTEAKVFTNISTAITSSYTPNLVVLAKAQNNYNQSAALSVTLAVGTFILSFLFLKLTNRRAGA